MCIRDSPWIKKYSQKCEPQGILKAFPCEKSLTRGEKPNIVKQGVYCFMVHKFLQGKDLDGFAKAFRVMDFDHDGILSRDDIRKSIEMFNLKISCESLCSYFNLHDQKDSVEYTEFVGSLICTDTEFNHLSKLQMIFNLLDKVDNDGYVDKRNIEDLLFKKHIPDSVWADFVHHPAFGSELSCLDFLTLLR
eukprot:TRINITY_DN11487_c0_g2_i3.p1 TRINITY_DN11487_c0_g2~~TRINITY_DN11487_c0_g2_i3.p1  ORF type:complete len:211 (-),score=37.00 TRINITY_DN11487_c0_g2_i3:161-733(-)